MTDYEERYEGNGEDLGNYGSPRGNNHGGADDYSHSKSQGFVMITLEVSYSSYSNTELAPA
ncbi:hypothetical protein Acr_22g0002200 [Actinidia rufa]|uniref:Uncharacterized protein n=1 Tax=Actinidia rufa TaxID=165716 RepID=A0A7J0GJA0_9ERIC|nr:hypothetical protein Acr_22g0002200 [Actinidia rufa]